MKKLLALFLTLALLLSVLPMALGVSAAEATGSGDYAIYFDSSISNNFWVTQKDSSHLEIGMEELNLPAGNIYTVEYDVYALTAGSNVVFGATTATWSTGSAIKDGHQVWKSAPTSVSTWTHYSFNVTTTADWKGVMFYVIDDADGFTGYIDNLTIKDSTGKVVSSFEPTADDISNKSNCASIVELSADVAYAKNPDYAVYIDNSANDIQSNQIWFNVLGMSQLQLPAGKTYTLKFDNYALSASTGGHGYKPIDSTAGEVIVSGGTWWNTNDVINGWATQSREFTVLEDKNALAYHTLYVGAGFKGYLDNFRVYDGETEVARLEFDASNLGKENSGATVVLLPVDIANAKPCNHVYDNACDATCNLCEEVREVAGHVYDDAFDADCNECGAVRVIKDCAVLVDNSAGTGYGQLYLHEVGMPSLSMPAGEYTVQFDFYAIETGDTNFPIQITNPNWNGDAVSQKWMNTPSETGKWVTVSKDVTATQEGAYPWFYVGAGIKGYLDNFKVIDKATGKVCVDFKVAETDIGKVSKDINTVVELPAEIEYEKNPDYAVLIDNSKGTAFGQLYLNEVGMAHDKVYPVGDYTIKFDFYALKIVDNKNIVACMAAAGWSGNAFPGNEGQVWLEIANKTGEWQTLSFDVTTVKDGQFPNFHIGAGLKGYFDNYQIIDKSTGETVLNFSPVAADLGKVSKTICEVVKVPYNPSDIECKHEYDNDCDTTCNLCEEVREVGDHVYENYVSNNNATCTSNATETGKCACGAEDTREIADSKAAHSYKDIVDTDCNVCGAVREVPQDVINGCTVSPVFGRGTVNGLPLDSCVQEHATRLYTAYTYNRADFDSITVGEGCRVYVQFFNEDGTYPGGSGWKFAGTYTMDQLGYGNAKYFKITFDSADGATTPPETGLTLTLKHVYSGILDADCNKCGAEREVVVDTIEGCTLHPVLDKGTVNGEAGKTTLDNCVASHATRLYTAYTYEVADIYQITVGADARIFVQFFNEDGTYKGGSGWQGTGTYTVSKLGYANGAKYFKITYSSTAGGNDAASPDPAGLYFTLQHTFENYISNNDATCTKNGTETGKCACGAEDTREIANSKLNHTYENYVSNGDATCTANGTETGKCACGATDTREDADSKLNHTYKDYVSNGDATCTANGTETGKCVCGDTNTREDVDSKLDHTYENYVSNGDATCTANGTETGKCVCGDTNTREDVDSKLDHVYDNTCDTDCNVCGGGREIAHTYDDEKDLICNVCGICKTLDPTLVKEDGVWYYYENGVKTNATTLVKYSGKWFYVKNGKWDSKITNTLVKYSGKWFWIKGGKWDSSFTNKLVDYSGKKFYIKGGKWDSSINDIVTISGTKYLIKSGKWSKTTTLFKKSGKYYAIKSGKVTKSKVIIKYNGKKYYCYKGYAQTSYSGKVTISGKKYTVKKGIIK